MGEQLATEDDALFDLSVIRSRAGLAAVGAHRADSCLAVTSVAHCRLGVSSRHKLRPSGGSVSG